MNKNRKIRPAGFSNAEKDQLELDSHTVANSKTIELHYSAADNFTMAAKLHLEAAKYHEVGQHEKANQNAFHAIGFAKIASRFQLEDAIEHAKSH